MSAPLSEADLLLLCREAEMAATRIVRRLRLPIHEREDIRQDLLVDLIARLKSYDSTRGTLGAFARKVIAHRAARLTHRLRRERDVFAPVSLQDPLADSEDATLGDTLAESCGYPALMGQSTDSFADLGRRLDLDRALGTLRRSDLARVRSSSTGRRPSSARTGSAPGQPSTDSCTRSGCG